MIQRVVVIGNAAGGKTRLSRNLAQRYGLPVFHVDSLQFFVDEQAKLRMRPFQQTLHELDQIQLAERWIIDGFGPLDHLQQRFSLADKIVLIDLPLRVHYFWAVKRIIGLIFKARPELPIGAQELRLDHLLKLFDSIKKYHRLMRPELLRILARPANSAKLVHINSVSNLNLILSQGIE